MGGVGGSFIYLLLSIESLTFIPVSPTLPLWPQSHRVPLVSFY
uniref:Uncharacterized protein n=1 Tax=Setaria viridis TaxID=4556 RepID=A0A4U6VFI7_SETVI|nr:hypothetical protein SEVIR_3G209566v2 [Setaria viridis]